MTAPKISPVERMEQALFDLLHLLSAAEDAAFALVEHSLDPEAAPAQFFAASCIQHEMRQARSAVEFAQQRIAEVFTTEATLVIAEVAAPDALSLEEAR